MPPGDGHAPDAAPRARAGLPPDAGQLAVGAGAGSEPVLVPAQDDGAGHAPAGLRLPDGVEIDAVDAEDDSGDGDGAEYDVADGDGATANDTSGPDPLRFNRWMRSSASGGILTGIALGLQHALEERREQPAFVMEAPGEPEDPEAPISLHFDPDDPTKTVAVIRASSHDGHRDGSPPPAGDVRPA